MNPLDHLIEDMKEAGADRLLDLLRGVHAGSVRVDPDALARPRNPAAAAAEPETVSRGEASAETQRHAAGPWPSGDARDRNAGAERRADEPQPYDRARRFFVELEQKLGKQESTAGAVIERLRTRDRLASGRGASEGGAGAATPQQLVSIVALAGTRAGGRFVVTQPFDSSARVELRAGPLRGADGRVVPADLTLSPAAFEMGPRSRRIVRVDFDLAGCAVADGELLTAVLEAAGPRGRALLKVLVEIEVHALAEDSRGS